MLTEGARFPSREVEERVKSQLLGRTFRDIAFGEGEREANEETRTEASEETGGGSEGDREEMSGVTPAEARSAMRWQWVTRVKERWRAKGERATPGERRGQWKSRRGGLY